MGIHTILQTGRQQIPSRRIGWIDIAKGIAILLVIIGHTVKFGGGTRNFIFFVSYAFVFYTDWVYQQSGCRLGYSMAPC